MALEESLTVASILDEARARAGLDDLGDEHFKIPLRMLVDSLREDNKNSSASRLLVRGSFVHLVENRIRIHDALERDPAIRDVEIRRPVVVTGIPRSGTTLLHNLLAQDPSARPLLFFESISPVPDEAPDQRRRVRKAEMLVKMIRRFMPAMARAHALDPTGPEECLGLLQNTFVTPFMTPFFTSGQIQYRAWLESLPIKVKDRSYEEYRTQLQILQGDDERRWALKCPCHLFGLDSLMRVVQEACVVQTHRALTDALPSLCSLQSIVGGRTSPSTDPAALGTGTAVMVERLLQKGLEARRPENAERFADVRFEDLLEDPIGTVRGIYARFDLPVTPAFDRGMEKWLASNPRHKHGKHTYELDDWGYDRDELVERFRWYHDRFGLDRLA